MVFEALQVSLHKVWRTERSVETLQSSALMSEAQFRGGAGAPELTAERHTVTDRDTVTRLSLVLTSLLGSFSLRGL